MTQCVYINYIYDTDLCVYCMYIVYDTDSIYMYMYVHMIHVQYASKKTSHKRAVQRAPVLIKRGVHGA